MRLLCFLILSVLIGLSILQTTINNCGDLQNIKNNLNATYELANDFNCSSLPNFEPIGNISFPFTGMLDGKGYSVSNLTVEYIFNDAGIMGVGSGCLVKDLILKDIKVISSNSGVASLFGSLYNSNVSNIQITTSDANGINHITATGMNNSVGGLVIFLM